MNDFLFKWCGHAGCTAYNRVVKKIYGTIVKDTKRRGRGWKGWRDAMSKLVRVRGISGESRNGDVSLAWSTNLVFRVKSQEMLLISVEPHFHFSIMDSSLEFICDWIWFSNWKWELSYYDRYTEIYKQVRKQMKIDGTNWNNVLAYHFQSAYGPKRRWRRKAAAPQESAAVRVQTTLLEYGQLNCSRFGSKVKSVWQLYHGGFEEYYF